MTLGGIHPSVAALFRLVLAATMSLIVSLGLASTWSVPQSGARRSAVAPLDVQRRYPGPGDGLVVESAGQAAHADGADYRPVVENRDSPR